jgi:hypothetical protein
LMASAPIVFRHSRVLGDIDAAEQIVYARGGRNPEYVIGRRGRG